MQNVLPLVPYNHLGKDSTDDDSHCAISNLQLLFLHVNEGQLNFCAGLDEKGCNGWIAYQCIIVTFLW
jgi:hypothetical protein